MVGQQVAHAVRAAPRPRRRLRAAGGVGVLQRVALVPRVRVHVVVGAVLAAAELQPALADAEVGRVVVGVGQLRRPAHHPRGVEAADPDAIGRAVPEQRREVAVGLGGDAAALQPGAEIQRAGQPIGGVEANDARVRRGRGPGRVADQRPAVGERRRVHGRDAQHRIAPDAIVAHAGLDACRHGDVGRPQPVEQRPGRHPATTGTGAGSAQSPPRIPSRPRRPSSPRRPWYPRCPSSRRHRSSPRPPSFRHRRSCPQRRSSPRRPSCRRRRSTRPAPYRRSSRSSSLRGRGPGHPRQKSKARHQFVHVHRSEEPWRNPRQHTVT